MKERRIFVLLLLHIFFQSVAPQHSDIHSSESIPGNLKINANAVVRYEYTHLDIQEFDKIIITSHRVVTVLNEYGIRHHNAIEFYNDKTKIKLIEATIYDSNGNEVKKFKAKHFKDESAVSGGTLYADDRVKYLDYVPVKYPYTVDYKSEVELRSTAFIPSWRPVDGFYLSVEYSEFKIENNSGIELRTKSERFSDFNIQQKDNLHYVATQIPGIKYEVYNPGILNIVPLFKSALSKFSMEGVEGYNNNWQDFGLWMHTNLIADTNDLPQSVINEVTALTANCNTKEEKAKKVYEYLQDKTRYISVQVGIGGWKPMDASLVDELGYSDCKGLTNYTKALLEAVGVQSYYTVVYGDDTLKDMDSEFSMTEGNHVILCVPDEENNIFLECTSQTTPFGFIAGFTDDREVLLVTPEGGRIARTTIYGVDESQKHTYAEVNIEAHGAIEADVEIRTTGYLFNQHEPILRKTSREQDLYYKEYWGNINNLGIISINLQNSSDKVELTESLQIRSDSYVTKSGGRIIMQPNMFNNNSKIPPRYSERTTGFRLQRGLSYTDEYVISIPENIRVEALSKPVNIETPFGVYRSSVVKENDTTLRYVREQLVYKGDYKRSDYQAYRDFKKRIAKSDKLKIVLNTN